MGHRVHTPTLTGCEPNSPRVGTHIALAEWTRDVINAVTETDQPVVLVAHSQAGIPVRCALEQCAASVMKVIYLDAAVPRDGERGVDLNPPGVPAAPPDLDPSLSIPARPVGPEQGFTNPELIAFVNSRLVPTPLGPSLDPAQLSEVGAGVPAHFVFFSGTPATYPCQLTRSRLDAEAMAYTVLDGPHDAPLTQPLQVAKTLVRLVPQA
jgi:hypothetical protein